MATDEAGIPQQRVVGDRPRDQLIGGVVVDQLSDQAGDRGLTGSEALWAPGPRARPSGGVGVGEGGKLIYILERGPGWLKGDPRNC